MKIDVVQPEGWKLPRGYSNAVRVHDAAKLLFIAGQIAWDADQKLVGANDFAAQFAQALKNVVTLVKAAGGEPQHLVRMTIYVADRRQYLAAMSAIGEHWRALLGKHYPAMSLVEVSGLLEPGALVEIEATAALG